MYAEATKVCNGLFCNGKERPLSKFDRNRAARDGLQAHCRGCRKHHRCTWLQTEEGKASYARSQRNWRKQNTASMLFKACRRRAKERGMEFTLTLEWIAQRLLEGVCEVTGIAFVLGAPKHAFLPSIDRIDSSKGYTPENCRVVLWFINAAKMALPEDDFQPALRQVAEAVVERL